MLKGKKMTSLSGVEHDGGEYEYYNDPGYHLSYTVATSVLDNNDQDIRQHNPQPTVKRFG